ncbi:MAG: TerB family tellurite resistance protein [Candidatus Delongbacteria bacterium]|jgi:DnaJ like chaperone protein|nr:TerB family tellurite resistance protein [Candidatus Delongbacteria bacterium]
MSFKGTLLGATVGFFLGGPIAALLGGMLGSFLSADKPEGNKRIYSSDQKLRSEFTYSLVILFAVVIKADRITKKSEVLFVKDYLVNSFGAENAKEMMQLLKALLEKDIDVKAVCSQIRTSSSYPFRLELVHLLFKLAVADGVLVDEEIKALHEISAHLGVYSIDFSRIASMFFTFQQGRTGGRKRTFSSRDKLDNAYDVLGIPQGSSKADVKKAFRTLSKKYHPDKVEHLGEEFKNIAAEKFIKIKEAYDRIMEA